MTLNDQIFGLVRTRGADAGLEFLDSLGAGRDKNEKRTIAHWRASIFSRKGSYSEALNVLEDADSYFDCRSSLAFQKAELLQKLGRMGDAIAAIRLAPIAGEIEIYPGLAWEAAFLGCYLSIQSGLPPPREWLDLIPDDFATRIDNKPVGKSFLKKAYG